MGHKHKHKIVALLPMKANSERIKGKNFRLLAGKPLFKWILDSLLAVDVIDKVVINTDARLILEENGLVETDKVMIIDRKPELCGDLVSMNFILADDIENIDAKLFIMTHTTNPFLSTASIRDAIACVENNGDQYDSLFMVNKIQTRFYNEDFIPLNHDPKNLTRTQDLEPWYEENSCMYLFSKKSFKKTNARIGEKPKMYVTPALEAIDIDEPSDWIMAEALAQYRKNNKEI